MNLQLHNSIRKASDEFDVPADALITSPELREQFAADVRTGADQLALRADEGMCGLLRLRECRGLPRLWR